MIKNQNIICISSIDWDFVWQGHQEIMSTFAKNGNKVLFIENTGIRLPTLRDLPRLKKRIINWRTSIKGFRKITDNLYIYSPIIIPFPYSKIAGWLNKFLLIAPLKRWMKAAEFHDPIIWTFLPTGTALDIIDSIDKKLLVYYCIADFYELAGSSKKVQKTEDKLIKMSDLIFAQGDVLKNKCIRLNDNVHIFPFGVRVEIFENFKFSPDNVPQDIRDIKKPIIGYIGGVHRHIDFKLIKFMAQSHPEWSIVLIGPIQTDISEIKNLGNIYLLDKKDFLVLPDYIYQFDVAIIPYVISEYTKTVFPTKLNEYHAMGKTVVSTDLPEVIKFNTQNNNLILVGKTYDDFNKSILKALNTNRQDLRDQQVISARKNSWSARIEQMSNLLETILETKAKTIINWQERFLKLYKTTRKNILKISTFVLCIYFLLFYTPLIWFVATPLKAMRPPENADCIVVFAGGVGESGEAGQGYEERVKRGVELFKNGYANSLIFVSGFAYIYKEPYIMKSLAVSLGVPPDAILLEERGGNTYQYIYFLKQRLMNNRQNKILLVSSPYNMRRSCLVFKKVAPQIKVMPAPVIDSIFYRHGGHDNKGRKILKQANIQQIKAIIHEYLGIIYYYFKGYI